MVYDVIVIGGGPAGMMTAGRAGQLGRSVLLLEKNDAPGIKLLMTGKDRCNVTHYTDDLEELIDVYDEGKRFLYSSFSRFDNRMVMDFFERGGVKLRVERGRRVFPVTNRSADIRKVLLNFLKKNNVVIQTGVEVADLLVKIVKLKKEDRKVVKGVVLVGGEKIVGKKIVIATGGLSYPQTGSTGDGYKLAEKVGHSIIPPRPALTPILLGESFLSDLEGLSLRNVKISIWQDEKRVAERFGEALFTKRGMSGPIILDLSKKIGELLEARSNFGKLFLKIDFKPALNEAILDKRLQRDFLKYGRKQFKNALGDLLPTKMIPVILERSGINPEKIVSFLTKDERRRLGFLLKNFTLTVKDLVGFSKAIITAGGVDWREVDSKTMESRLVKGLCFAGEVLNLDGPTGGYNLQIAWSTGWAAGSGDF